MAWVKFHEQLRQGEKRGMSRATRFVFLELCLLARDERGSIRLPRGMSDLDAVHDLLGGNRKEVRAAFEELSGFTENSPKTEPMIDISGESTGRVLTIRSWERWNGADDPAKRMRELRQRKQVLDSTALRNSDVTSDVTPPQPLRDSYAPEKSREEQRRAEPPISPPGGTTGSARPMASFEQPLSLPFGPTIPAPPGAIPETLGTGGSARSVEPTARAPKGKQPTAVARVLSPEQVALRRRVSDCWYEEFTKARGEKPSFDTKNLNECKRLLEKFDWNADRVCEIIGNAFRQKSFVEYRCKLSEILNNTTQYQGKPESSRAVSTGQVFPSADRWDRPLEDVQS
jgi:hypothetical protein